MKKIVLICILILLAIPAWSTAGVIAPLRIQFLDGDVMFRTPDAGEWLQASINTPLDEGDAVWCAENAKAEIQLSDGSIVRLDGGSQLDLIANEDGFTHLHLASGKLYLRTAQNSANNSLQIDADDTTVLPDARTRLRIDMLPDSQEDVAIFKGSAYVEGNGNRTKVRAGDHIALEEGHSELLPLNPPDSWENWNTGRDRIKSRSTKADSYLPDELRSHSAELDSNGSWVSAPEYGMVWRPTVIISDDWAPYRSGRWIWRGNDYVWVSFESWGWVPYHYGRWAVISGFGWCWVPPLRGDVYWGPGYVGWYSTGSQIAWTPLAPGEIFYGYGQYGRHSVNISNSRINTSTIDYRNRHIRGGLTLLPKNDFLKGRTAAQHNSPPSVAGSIAVSAGSPRIKPQHETRMPIVKQTPPRIVPPRVDHQDSRELRQRFQRVIPQSDSERRNQQPATVTPAPAVPKAPTAPLKEKRTLHPVALTQPASSTNLTPPQRVEPQTRTTNPIPVPHMTTPQRGGQPPRPEPVTRDMKQKKVWKVTTPDDAKEKDNREKEYKGRENKNR
ncbi:MAG: FecR domain-containing protein [Desulfuromonadaceae bacterium]|nr:FecR domain-containing protein [Desulfuromonadaceae bacterium]